MRPFNDTERVGAMQIPLRFRHTEASEPARAPEKMGAVYTRPRIAELILNVAGYELGADLAAKFAVEPTVGEGALQRTSAKESVTCSNLGRRCWYSFRGGAAGSRFAAGGRGLAVSGIRSLLAPVGDER
jgi:hypothetical protein